MRLLFMMNDKKNKFCNIAEKKSCRYRPKNQLQQMDNTGYY